MLFSRSDFVEKAWEIVDPIIESIKKRILNYTDIRLVPGDHRRQMIYSEI